MGACSAAQPVPPTALAPKPKASKRLYFHAGFKQTECREIFLRFDTQNTGKIGPRSIRPCLSLLAGYCEVAVPPDRLGAFVEDLFLQLDLDGDGCLHFTELCKKLNPRSDAMELDGVDDRSELAQLRQQIVQTADENKKLAAILQTQRSASEPEKAAVGESAELLKQMVELGAANQKRHEEQVALLAAQIAALKQQQLSQQLV